jgi:acetyltransferase-like isoleucine patch superfamily enzyme
MAIQSRKDMKSKTRIVRCAMIIRPVVVVLWRYTPKYLSKLLMSLFRNGESGISFAVRYLCLKRLASYCGEKVIVFPYVIMKNCHNLSVGNNVSIHEFTYIDSFGGVSIGDDVAISHNVSIISFDHNINKINKNHKDSGSIVGKISIENNVWIGAGSRILKDVTIEGGSVVGAGSVVTKDCPAYTVCCGVPAKSIKSIHNHNN